MIQISGMPFQQSDAWPKGSIESDIIQRMQDDSAVYLYKSIDELTFEIKLRKNIIEGAIVMDQGDAEFASFEKSYCNPEYWNLTYVGGFQLRSDVKPSEAILDIYKNSSLYAYECSTGMIIIYYYAVLRSIGEHLFNQLFQNIYLYSWHSDSDLGIHSIHSDHFIPGDVVYFQNPDVDPEMSWWRGENAVDLGDGTFFGHGLGINNAVDMINALNEKRKPGSIQSAYLTNSVARPSFKHLAHLSKIQRSYSAYKFQHFVIHHNESSISFYKYLQYLKMFYHQMTNMNPI
ncbi:protein-glutamine gamma-glutamyltransferase [Bacillus sp. FJAT-49732]|uniref:Protein-glutamine gamma-glutamyltransferase n=1 Tax=Lederbergia citrisecunda TaxID=2833583 RepID=A0A942TLA5_9BACI|nr:protein-glutamine gamma-glutamyltransferase [Lederbergia citrisecunda]MBS4198339.1 protein-glutamine gamma-glutamyltransferase [Lederbergia citrisecunda]